MRKHFTKQAALLISCTMLALAGCGDAGKTDSTPTPAPTSTSAPTEAPAATATTAPTSAPEPTATTAPTMAPQETLTPEPTATTAPTETPIPTQAADPTATPAVSGTEVAVESITIQDEHTILITLNAPLEKVSRTDISLTRYNVDWTAHKEVSGELTITDFDHTTNDKGNTVLIYTVADTLRTTSAVLEKKASNFSDLNAAITLADNYISWQMDNGGWDKGIDGKKPWNGTEKKNKGSGWTAKDGGVMGTIDNDATYSQIRHIAAVYREVPDAKYQESVLKGLDFLFDLQYESGGFAQVYPRRGNYSDMVTFNDNAMINVLYTLEDMLYHRYPFDSDIIPADYLVKIEESIDLAIDFILKSQIVTADGRLTAWCAQHDPVTYEPVAARAYELASISGSESVPVLRFLMNQEQTPEIQKAVEAGIQWFKDSEQKDTEYVRKASDGVYFKNTTGHRTWYRFYEIDTNLPIFCDRDGIMKHDIMEIGEERRHGYAWAGDWAKKVLKAYDDYGYVTGTITAKVVGYASQTADGQSFEIGAEFTIGK